MADASDLDRLINERLDELLPKKLAELRQKQTPSMTIIATKGTLDWAYPPFIRKRSTNPVLSRSRR